MAAKDDPTRLVRDSAGAYHSADDRFSVRNEGGTWYAEDSQQLDELGLAHVLGPFPSLTEAKQAMTDARSRKVTAITPRPAKRARRAERATPPAPEWTDALPADERTSARRMAKSLEQRGIADVREIIVADRLGLVPGVAASLIRHRVAREAIDAWDAAAVRDVAADLGADDVAALAREVARRTVERVYRILDEGAAAGREAADLPGWELSDTPKGRRIRLG
ncbi:MAG TPA: hypothetical protein VJ975_11150 [Candidatus Limnocylindria bacterium]|nr:hypothetical protein [Candidatus Limnocylindria bacterium]